jgi:3-oxoacyl-[acyl-carrier-protein] synthase II
VVLAGGVEELCYETFYGFYRSGALCHSPGRAEPHPVPFDRRRNGFFVAEGSALLVIEEADFAARRGAPVLAEIRGHGSAFDWRSESRPNGHSERYGHFIARAVQMALDDAGLATADVQAVSASANGSRADAAEAAALVKIFGDSSDGLPVAAIKGMLGEPLGAGGALQTVGVIEAISSRLLPGIAGFEEAEAVPPGWLSESPREVAITHALVNSVGLDGNCSSLIVGRP